MKVKAFLPGLVRVENVVLVREVRPISDLPLPAVIVLEIHAGNRNLGKRLLVAVQAQKTVVAYFVWIENAAVVALAAFVAGLIRMQNALFHKKSPFFRTYVCNNEKYML